MDQACCFNEVLEVRLIQFRQHVFLKFTVSFGDDDLFQYGHYYIDYKGGASYLQTLVEVHQPLQCHILVLPRIYNRIILHPVKHIAR